MRGKRGTGTEFSLMNVGGVIAGLFVSVLLMIAVFKVSTKDAAAEASAASFLENIDVAIGEIRQVERPLVAGTVDEDIWLVGFNSGVEKPDKCSSVTNSCICICEDLKCGAALECRYYSREFIKKIELAEQGSTKDLALKGHINIYANLSLEDDVLRLIKNE